MAQVFIKKKKKFTWEVIAILFDYIYSFRPACLQSKLPMQTVISFA